MRCLLLALGFVGLAACSSVPAGMTAPDDSSSNNSTAKPATPAKTIADFPGSKIFMPVKTPAPGIVMLHGSEGGSEPFIQEFAAGMAKEGFVVVTLCWFGCDGKPPTINRIPLESVIDIGHWLAASPDVDAGNVGLFGWSRGAEMSLLVTSLAGTDPFKVVAVHAPSDTVVSAFDPATENNPPDFGSILETDATGQSIPAPSWTWKGQPLFGEPKADFSVPGPLIEVTKYTGPLYVSQGERDEVWPVARGRHVVSERAAVAGLVTQSHFFPNEGHVLQKPADLATQQSEIAAFFHKGL